VSKKFKTPNFLGTDGMNRSCYPKFGLQIHYLLLKNTGFPLFTPKLILVYHTKIENRDAFLRGGEGK
jgi:hypothetical protein